MSDQPPMMKCDWCGKEFPADARACVESGVAAYPEPMEGDEWKGSKEPTPVPAQFSAEQRDQIKAEMELDDAQLDELLRTGKIEGLGAIVCLECQDSALKESE